MPGIANTPAGMKRVDPAHPHVKEITDAGFPMERLTALVNNAPKGITHEAVSAEQNQANQLAAAQQSQQQQNQGIYIPPLDTAGFQQASELAPIFSQMLAQIVTPPVPNEPQLANTTPTTGPTNG